MSAPEGKSSKRANSFCACGSRQAKPFVKNEMCVMAASARIPASKKAEMTVFLKAAQARGCRFQIGTDMLFEQIPAYLEFFGFPTTTPENLRAVARLSY